MILKSRISPRKSHKKKPPTEIFFENGWFSFGKLAKHNKLSGLNLNSAVLYHRWQWRVDSKGFLTARRTEKSLFKKKNDSKKNSTKSSDAWLYEGCTPEQKRALLAGTNKALLDI